MAQLLQSQRPTLTVNGRVFTDLTTLISTAGRVATTARFTTLRKSSASAGYQTTSGKTLTYYAYEMVTTDNPVVNSFTLLYGDTDVGLDSAAGPTNTVYACGDSTLRLGIHTAGSTSGFVKYFNLPFAVPSTKYGAFLGSGVSSSLVAFGYEV